MKFVDDDDDGLYFVAVLFSRLLIASPHPASSISDVGNLIGM